MIKKLYYSSPSKIFGQDPPLHIYNKQIHKHNTLKIKNYNTT